MASIGVVAKGTSPAYLYSLLHGLDAVYGVGNVLMLITITLVLCLWALERIRRRPPSHGSLDVQAGVLSALFFLAALMGIGTLAIFEAARGWNGYVSPLYWTDFSTPAELFLVFGAIATWSALVGRLTRTMSRGFTPGLPETERAGALLAEGP